MTRRMIATLAFVLPQPFAFLGSTAEAASLAVSSSDRTELHSLVTATAAPRTEATALPPPCARKVKIVYPGYGEAARATCATSELRPGG